ncbi:hypothetical protein CBS14141_001385 [Malassezia furfur]|nr:hypothetical protein CBS14141_001385 [Malassezia furfur]
MRQARSYAQGQAFLRSAAAPGEVGAPIFSHLEGRFPLRLLTPRASSQNATRNAAAYGTAPVKGVGVLFVLNYGGGLVSGDHIDLDFDVGSHTRLLSLTQGSTKVYCERRTGDPPAVRSQAQPARPVSKQYFRYIVRPDATLIILPAPVTCFARSRYDQTQLVDLRDAHTSSLILLDWFTSGRLFVDGPKESTDRDRIPEFWHFYQYRSRNEVRVNGQVIARDCLDLSQDLPEIMKRDEPTDLSRRCAPYTCYATLILYGPETHTICDALQSEFDEIQQAQPLLRSGTTTGPTRVDLPPLLWCTSSLASSAPVPGSDPKAAKNTQSGLVVRLAGIDTDEVRNWLYQHLQPVCHLVGSDMYRMALG